MGTGLGTGEQFSVVSSQFSDLCPLSFRRCAERGGGIWCLLGARDKQIPRRFAPRNDKGKMTARSCFARGHAIMVRFRRQSDH